MSPSWDWCLAAECSVAWAGRSMKTTHVIRWWPQNPKSCGLSTEKSVKFCPRRCFSRKFENLSSIPSSLFLKNFAVQCLSNPTQHFTIFSYKNLTLSAWQGCHLVHQTASFKAWKVSCTASRFLRTIDESCNIWIGYIKVTAKAANEASRQTKRACWWPPTLKHLLQHYEPWQRTAELALFSAWIERFGLASGCFISFTQCANWSLDYVVFGTWEWYHLGFSEIDCRGVYLSNQSTNDYIYIYLYTVNNIYISYIRIYVYLLHSTIPPSQVYMSHLWRITTLAPVGRQELIQFTDIPPTRRVLLLQLSFERPSAQKGPQPCEFLPFGMMTWQMICQKPLFYTTSRDMRKLLTDCTNATKLHKNNTETTGLKLKGTDHRPQRLKLLRRPVETAMKHWDCWRKKRRSSGLFHLKISSDILLLVTPFTLLPLFQPPNFSALEALASCNPCLGGCQTLLRLPQCPKKSKAQPLEDWHFLDPSHFPPLVDAPIYHQVTQNCPAHGRWHAVFATRLHIWHTRRLCWRMSFKLPKVAICEMIEMGRLHLWRCFSLWERRCMRLHLGYTLKFLFWHPSFRRCSHPFISGRLFYPQMLCQIAQGSTGRLDLDGFWGS